MASIFLAVGCGRPNPPYSFDIDRGCPATTRDAVLHGMDAWDVYAEPRHLFNIDGDEWRVICGWGSPSPCAEDHSAGCTSYDEQTVWIAPGFDENATLTIATHELGHVWGLEHAFDGVMKKYGLDPTIKPIDVQQCQAVGACR